MLRANKQLETQGKSPFRLRYYGPEWSFLAVFGKENYDTFFTQVDLFHEALGTIKNIFFAQFQILILFIRIRFSLRITIRGLIGDNISNR